MMIQKLRVAFDEFQIRQRAVAQAWFGETFVQRPEDQGERRAQLVADIGEELCFQLIEFQGLLIQIADAFVGSLELLVGGLRRLQCSHGFLVGLFETVMGVAEKNPHGHEQSYGKKTLGILYAQGKLWRNKTIPDQKGRDERSRDSSSHAADLGTEKHRWEKKKPNERVDERPKDPLDEASGKGEENRYGKP